MERIENEDMIRNEIVTNEDYTLEERKEPTNKRGLRNFMRKNADKIVVGGYLVLVAGLTIGGIIAGCKNQKKFDTLIKEKYGNNVKEGCFAEGNLKKLWDGNRTFEESYKGNFDKVADFVKDLDMRADETYSISRVVDKTGKLATELVQIRDGGFYHGINL